MKTHLTLFILVAVSIFSCTGNSQQSSSNVKEADSSTEPVRALLSVNDFKSQLASSSNAQLVDVRTPEEHSAGHIDGSLNLDIFAEIFDQQLGDLDKNKPLFLYCRSGGRSSDAATKAIEMGFKKVYDLDGGYSAWPKEQQ